MVAVVGWFGWLVGWAGVWFTEYAACQTASKLCVECVVCDAVFNGCLKALDVFVVVEEGLNSVLLWRLLFSHRTSHSHSTKNHGEEDSEQYIIMFRVTGKEFDTFIFFRHLLNLYMM